MEGTTTALDMSTISTALVEGLTEAAHGMIQVVADLIPIATLVMGTILVVGFGIKAFKKVTGR